MIDLNAAADEARRSQLAQIQSAQAQADPYATTVGFYGSPASTYADRMQSSGYGAQRSALRMYGDAASGRAPSVAQLAGNQALSDNLRAGFGQMASARGPSAAALSAVGYGTTGGQATGVAAAAAEQRQREQFAALQAYGQLGSQIAAQGQSQDQIAMDRALRGDQIALDWYRAKKGLDLSQRAMDRDFWGGIIRGGMGALAGATDAGASMAREYNDLDEKGY